MDGCSGWSSLPFQIDSVLQQEQDHLPISSQVGEQLKQIYLLMDMEEHGHAEAHSSQQSSTFSPDEVSSLIMPGSSSSATNNSCHNTPEVTSLNIPATDYYDDRHYAAGQCYYGDLDMTLNLEEFTHQQVEAHHEKRAQRKNGAFMPYSRHLSPKKKPKPGTGGQRAIKAAMSALTRMHMVRLAQWKCYQMEMAVAPPATTGSNDACSQQQHVLSERKRREKLNDNFKELMAVLPTAPKKDKASILIGARDYVNTLKSRVAELEERNRVLLESRHH